jgi:nitrite reductase (NADH) small subunit
MQKILLGKAGDVPPGRGKTFVAHGTMIVVANHDGELHAYENKCPHMGGAVRYDGERKLVCSWHGAQFEAATGDNIVGAEGQALRKMTVVVEGEDLYWMKEEQRSPWADDF